jgi:hypothetical protein
MLQQILSYTTIFHLSYRSQLPFTSLPPSVHLSQFYEDVPSILGEPVDKVGLDIPQDVDRPASLGEELGHRAIDVLNTDALQLVAEEETPKIVLVDYL